MFLDFCYAAWKRVAHIDPYIARRHYVKAADSLLREIPGGHHNVMDSWHKWKKSESPPIPGYPNSAWDKVHAVNPIIDEGPKQEAEIPEIPARDDENDENDNVSTGSALDLQLYSAAAEKPVALTPTIDAFQAPVDFVKHLAIMGG
jgi:hypothetical protein